MIDAYEIGIQLALQDDVTAGLEVISRGLAEVDRAIDATSAKLITLSAAETAAGIAVSGLVRASPADERGQARPEEAEAKPPAPAGDKAVAPMDIAPVTAPSSSQISFRGTETPPSTVTSIAAEQPKSAPVAPAGQPSVPAAATTAEQGGSAMLHVQHSIEQVAPAIPARPASTPERPKERGTWGSAVSVAGPAATIQSVAPDVGDVGSPAREARVFTSAIGQAIAPAQDMRADQRVAAAPGPDSETPSAPAGRAAAPWSGVESRVHSSKETTASEKAVAPQARPQDRSEGLTGTVMLDGHLVGSWLTERMASEASRPPSGTSFFDPRQTPAWTASGSL